MIPIRKVPADRLDGRAAARPHLTAQQRARLAHERLFGGLIARLTDPSVVFEVQLGDDEKPTTIRQRLQRVAEQRGVEIATRTTPRGIAVGLLTPDRRRGRRRRGAAQAA